MVVDTDDVPRNQQFTGTNLTFNNCFRALYMNWDWIWFWRDITINNCNIGIEMSTPENLGSSTASFGSVTIVDSTFNNVSQAIITVFNCTNSQPPTAGTLVIENSDFTGTGAAVSYPNGTVILPGGQFIEQWMQGHTYSAAYQPQLFPDYNNQTCYVPNAPQTCVQGSAPTIEKPAGLLTAGNKVYDRAKPAYDDWSLSQFVSAKDNGCAGDGVQDDTVCLQNLFNNVNWNQIAYIDHGAYIVTDTIFIPKGIRIMGEGWPKIMIKSSPAWDDSSNPVPAFRVGNKGDKGDLEMQDLVFETMGPTPGAILMEWNLEEATQGSAGELLSFGSTAKYIDRLQGCGMCTGELVARLVLNWKSTHARRHLPKLSLCPVLIVSPRS
jgi:glucan 1,3-beta-glucosidase